MVSAIQSTTAGVSGTGAGDGSVALIATLARCKQQLGDWVACPSGKTPEGRKIIEALSSRITALEARMSISVKAADIDSTGSAAASTTSAAAARGNTNQGLSTTGRLINVYA